MSMLVEATPVVEGMGCLHASGRVAFRVWAPNADRVQLVGSFTEWETTPIELNREEGGAWYGESAEAQVGDEYKFILYRGEQRLERMDPWAREVTNSVGVSVVHDPEFDWGDDHFEAPPLNELVIYELHVGTFNRDNPGEPGGILDVVDRLAYLRGLGINAIELMPVAEFAGDLSWGYNPAQAFAVESSYGGPAALKTLVREAHRNGIAVILDVVYNHFGPSDLDLWQFDGWSENGKGGIYFYNDWRSSTPWGDTRPDYGRGEVRTFIHDNAMMWMRDYHMDGLRMDMTLFIRSVDGMGERDIPEGWSLTQWINRDIHAEYPRAITIAEDLQNNDWITKPQEWGGAGFSSQWDARFVHPVRAAVTAAKDADRSMAAVRDAICHRYNLDAFERVVYSESHDEVANGKQRVPSEIDPDDPTGWFAQKRSVLASCLALTVPGVPMLFQGQEFLRGGWFDDSRGVDWNQANEFEGLVALYRDLIALRKNTEGTTGGLVGQHVEVHHLNDEDKVIAFRRWSEGGRGDDVLVVANFSNRAWDAYRFGAPRAGVWRLRFNSDAELYSEDFGDLAATDLTATEPGCDGLPSSLTTPLAPYGVLVFSEDPSE